MNAHRIWMECIAKPWHRLMEAKRFVTSFSKLIGSHRPIMTECESEVSEIKARIVSGLLSRRLEGCRRELFPEPSDDKIIIPMSEIQRTNTHRV